MAKASPLTLDVMHVEQATPQAATAPRASTTAIRKPVPKTEGQTPLQIRIPKEAARAIKVAAAERDQSISNFMLACFHAYMHKVPNHEN